MPPQYRVERRSEKKEDGLLEFLMCGDCCSPGKSSDSRPPDYYALHNAHYAAMPLHGVNGSKLRHAPTPADDRTLDKEARWRNLQDQRQQYLMHQYVKHDYTALDPPLGSFARDNPKMARSNQITAQMYHPPINGNHTSVDPQNYGTQMANGIEPKQSPPKAFTSDFGKQHPSSTTHPYILVNAQETSTAVSEEFRQRQAIERKELKRMSAEVEGSSLSPEELRHRRAEERRLELERMSAEESSNTLSPEELRRRRGVLHADERRIDMDRLNAEEASSSLSPEELRRRRAEERRKVLASADEALKILSDEDLRRQRADQKRREFTSRQPNDVQDHDPFASPRTLATHTTITSSDNQPRTYKLTDREVSHIQRSPPETQVYNRQVSSQTSTRTAAAPPQPQAASIITTSNRSPTQLFQTSPQNPVQKTSPRPDSGTVMSASNRSPTQLFHGSSPQNPVQKTSPRPDSGTVMSASNRSPSQMFHTSSPPDAGRRVSPPAQESRGVAPSEYLASRQAASRTGSATHSPPQYIQTSSPREGVYGSDGSGSRATISSSNRSPTQLFAGSPSVAEGSPARTQDAAAEAVPRVVTTQEAGRIGSSTRAPAPHFDTAPRTGDVGTAMNASNSSPTQLFQGSPPTSSSPGTGRSLQHPPSQAEKRGAEVQFAKHVAVVPSAEINNGFTSSEGDTPALLSRETSDESHGGRLSPTSVVMEIESCVMLPCCKSKVPRAKVAKTIADTETCPCCGMKGINHTMLLPINPAATTDNTALVLPCCKSQVPRKHAERMLRHSSSCPVCFEPNITIGDLQVLDPLEISTLKNTTTFDLPRVSSTGSQGKRKGKKKQGSFKGRKVSSVYEDVGPGVKFFTDEEIQQMTAAQKQAIREARRSQNGEEGWDQMSLNFVSELLMKDAQELRGEGSGFTDAPAPKDITKDNPLLGFQRGHVDAGPPPSFAERQSSFNNSFGRNFVISGAGGSGKIKSYNEVKQEEAGAGARSALRPGVDASGRRLSEEKEKEERRDEEGWMGMSLSFVSDLLNAEAKQKPTSADEEQETHGAGGWALPG